GGGLLTSEYLARLLEKDYAGEDRGAVADRMERARSERSSDDFYMPAGSKGPTDRMGGAEERAPEPIRTPPEAREQAVDSAPAPPLTAPSGAPVELPEGAEAPDD